MTESPEALPSTDAGRASASVIASVLVPVLNEAASIRASVAAMLAQELDGPGEVEVLLADGGSQDGTRELLAQIAAQDPRVVLLDNPRRGTASGLNVCLAAARGTHVVRMDAHTTYPRDYVALGVRRLTAGDVTWVAGPQLAEAGAGISPAVVAALGTWLGRGSSAKWAAGGAESDLDTGVFCGVWRREDVLRHGGWDEGWPRNQDSEMAARFLRCGERIVSLPAMAARYQPRASFKRLWRQYHDYGIYRARTALRHPTSMRRSLLAPPGVVVAGVAAVVAPRVVRTPARALLAGYGAALVRATGQAAGTVPAKDAALVPAVLATMHVAHGSGFLRGMGRWGVPLHGLLRAVGVRRAVDEATFTGDVWAPALSNTAEHG